MDVILYKRLERIREELNAYIKQKYCCEDSHTIQVFSEKELPEKEKTDSVLGKFLFHMNLRDDDLDDADDLDEEESCQSAASAPRSMKMLQYLALDEVLEQKEESFSQMLLRIINEKGFKDSEVYKRANIDRRLFSKIRGDEEYAPSKKTAIAFCFALQLGMEETKKLLETAGYTLSASSRFDLIIMCLIENREYNIHFVNIVLDDYGEGTLSR